MNTYRSQYKSLTWWALLILIAFLFDDMIDYSINKCRVGGVSENVQNGRPILEETEYRGVELLISNYSYYTPNFQW